MPAVFYHPDGTASQNPTTLAAAKKHHKSRYDDLAFCPKCEKRNAKEPGNRCSTKHTASEKCVHCARLESILFYNGMILSPKDPPILTEYSPEMEEAHELFPFPMGVYTPAPTNPADAIAQGLQVWIRAEPCSRAGHLGVRTVNGGCWKCEKEAEEARNTPRITARQNGDTWYTPDTPCPDCHDTAQRHTQTNRCRGCHPLATDRPSPRQLALAAGAIWYTPDTPCPRCGALSPRRVNNGACQGCKPPTDTAATDMMRDCPDLIITKEDADALGFIVFRTGKACRRGHTGYRYVSTGGCIQCLKEPR